MRHLDTPRALRIVTPDHEQLERDHPRRGCGSDVHRVVERCVLDDLPRLLVQGVNGHDQATRRRHELLRNDPLEPAVRRVHEQRRSVRRQLARDRELELDDPFIRRIVAVLGEHRS
jgi:hypothetical protein